MDIDLAQMKDARGAHRTESLFNETIQPSIRKKFEPLYSLRDYDHKGYLSAYQIYMTSIDEYDAAIKLVGSMSHWRKLCALVWFMTGRRECGFEGLYQWREDMAARDTTEAKRVMLEQCKENNVSAARGLDKVAKDIIKKKRIAKQSSNSGSNQDEENFLRSFNKG